MTKGKKKSFFFDNIYIEKLHGMTSKYYLLQIVYIIKEIDQICSFGLGKNFKIGNLWLIIENLSKYFVIIDIYNENQ